ncbi:MAG: hypothetical protein JNL39_03940 [Opitutaceae bacterium]|nr:hypothetical protein [Opitutaceae bacterium]
MNPERNGLRAVATGAAFLIAHLTPAHAQHFNDGAGKEWRQLTETTGLSWAQVAAVASQDGVTPAIGTVNGRALTGWVWATDAQVVQLFSRWAPAIAASPTLTVAGPEYVTPASQFHAVFRTTQAFAGCPTYQPCFDFRMTAGWTARSDATNQPVEAAVITSLDTFFTTGSFHVQGASGAAAGGIGVFLWRPTGQFDGKVHANDDAGFSPSPLGGAALNVLANDWIGGVRPTAATVTLTLESPAIAGLTLSADGTLAVAPGTAAGTHALVYRIAAVGNPANNDDAVALVTVRSYPIFAAADQGYVAFAAGGTAVANVLANDTLGGVIAAPSVVVLAQVSSSHAGVALNPATGAVTVAPGTPHGTHTLTYRIAERANPANTSQATVTIRPNAIYAAPDSARGSSKTGGTVIASVLANDTFSGARATTAKVAISLPAALPKGFALNLSTGAVTVAPKTSSGLYTFRYRITEIASPANFSEATVTIDLSGKSP